MFVGTIRNRRVSVRGGQNQLAVAVLEVDVSASGVDRAAQGVENGVGRGPGDLPVDGETFAARDDGQGLADR